MFSDIQEAINRLESLQCDILLWERKEDDSERKKMLSDYDTYIDGIIDILYEFGISN